MTTTAGLPQTVYSYAATLQRIVDADTVTFAPVDLGFRVCVTATVRLLGVNAPEKATPEGKQAIMWVGAWFTTYAPDGRCQLRTRKPADADKYGRWLALVDAGGHSLNADMLTAGIAVPYNP